MEKELIKILKQSFEIVKLEQINNFKKNKIKINELPKFDSLNYLKFISLLEKKFKLKVNKSDLTKLNRYKSIINLVVSKRR